MNSSNKVLAILIVLAMSVVVGFTAITADSNASDDNNTYQELANAVNSDANSSESVWDGTTPETQPQDYVVDDGLKTVTIGSAAALAWFAKVVNDGTTYQDYTVNLTVDINLDGKEWTPIGSEAKQFKGRFNGKIDDNNSHKIRNLKIDKPDVNLVGLFGYAGGLISDLILENAEVSGNTGVSALAGVPKGGLDNIKLTGLVKIYGKHYVGGLGGGAYCVGVFSNLTIDVSSDSYVRGNSYDIPDTPIHGEATYVGGVLGHFTEVTLTQNPNIYNITSNINVVGDVRGVGGIVGMAGIGTYMKDCICSGNVTLSDTPYKNFAEIVGGIMGTHSDGSTAVKLVGCEFTGELKSSYKEEGGSSTEFTDFLNDGMVGGHRKGQTGNFAVIIDKKVFFEGAALTGTAQSGNIQYISEGDDVYLYKSCEVQTGTTLPDANYHVISEGALTFSGNATLTFTGTVTVDQDAMLNIGGDSSLTIQGTLVNNGQITVSDSGILTVLKTGTLINNGKLVNNGTIDKFSSQLMSYGTVTSDGTGTIEGQTTTNNALFGAYSGIFEKQSIESPSAADKFNLTYTNGSVGNCDSTKQSATLEIRNNTIKLGTYTDSNDVINKGRGLAIYTGSHLAGGTDNLVITVTGNMFVGQNKDIKNAVLFTSGLNFTETVNFVSNTVTGVTGGIGEDDGIFKITVNVNSPIVFGAAAGEGVNVSLGTGFDQVVIREGSPVTLAGEFVVAKTYMDKNTTNTLQEGATYTVTDSLEVKGALTCNGTIFDKGTVTISGTITFGTNGHLYSALTLELNGGTGEDLPTQYDYVSGLTLPTAVTKAGYEFGGWYDNAELTGDPVTEIPANTLGEQKFYAKWSTYEVTITFKSNDGTGTTSEQSIQSSTPTALKPNEFTREGYAFKSWNTKEDGTGTSYADGQTVTLTEDLELYAIWDEYTLTVTFNANGGAGTMPQQTIKWSDAAKTLTPNTFTREGYNFAGWKVTEGTATYADQADVSALLTEAGGTLSLDAQWSTYEVTVTFDSNGGTGTMEAQKIQSLTPTALNENKFTRDGYNYVWWNTKADGTGITYANKEEVTLTGNLTLYAIWQQKPVEKFTVSFDTNGGSAIAPVSVQSGVIVEKPENPSKDGAKFAGWFSDAALATRYTFTEPVTKDITLYAKWIGVVNVSVPSGDGYTSTPAGVNSVTIGDEFQFTIAAKEGYTVTSITANGVPIGTAPGTFKISPTADTSIAVVFTKDGKTTESAESTVDNDDGTVTTNQTTTETDTSGNATISEKSTTKDGEDVKSTVTTTAEVTSSSVEVKIDGNTDDVTLSASIAEAIAAAGTVENKEISVTTAKKTVTIDKEAWDILGETDVTVTVNSGADFQASITVSKDSFDTQSALALTVLESSKDIPSDIGKTTKAFELDAKMGGNPVSSFSDEVRVTMVFESIPSSATKVYAYCIDTGDRVNATFDPATGEVTFDTPHFSSWTIIYEESSPSGGNMSTTALIIVAVILALVLITTAAAFRPKNENLN